MSNKIVVVVNKTQVGNVVFDSVRHFVSVDNSANLETVKKEYYKQFNKLSGDEFLVFDDMTAAKTYLAESGYSI